MTEPFGIAVDNMTISRGSVLVHSSPYCIVVGNTVTNSGGVGLMASLSDHRAPTGNIVSNTMYKIYAFAGYGPTGHCTFAGNTLSHNEVGFYFGPGEE